MFTLSSMLTWTKQTPSKPGWYWMLNPAKSLACPTIVQIVSDWETGRFLVLIPATHPQTGGMMQELRDLEGLWAGPIELPVVMAAAA